MLDYSTETAVIQSALPMQRNRCVSVPLACSGMIHLMVVKMSTVSVLDYLGGNGNLQNRFLCQCTKYFRGHLRAKIGLYESIGCGTVSRISSDDVVLALQALGELQREPRAAPKAGVPSQPAQMATSPQVQIPD